MDSSNTIELENSLAARLLASVTELASLPLAAAQCYGEKAEALIAAVNRSLTARADIAGLVGGNPLRVMFDNHRNHAHFVAAVMRLGHYGILARSIPWVYRAYLAQGFRPEYFVAELEAWQTAITTVLPAQDATAVLPLYDWMARHHEEWVELSREPVANFLVDDSDGRGRLRESVYRALRTGETQRAIEVMANVGVAIDDIVGVFEGVITPALAQIGADWESGRVTPAEEHRATAIALRMLAALQLRTGGPSASRGHAIVTAAPNEYHEVGAQMVASVLERDSWRVSYLGANTPEEDLIELVRSDLPQFVAISASMVFNLEPAAAVARALKDREETRGIKVMIGGRAVASVPGLGETLGFDATPSSLHELLLTAREWSLP